MNNFSKYAIVFLIYIINIGCSGNSLKPSDFKNYIENQENGFVKKVDVAPYAISCMYMPPSYMVVNHFRKNDIDNNEYESKLEEYQDFDLYRLEIKSNGQGMMNELGEYFSFYMQDNIVKVCEKDTIPCDIYHAEPYNSIAGTQKIELGFVNNSCQATQVILKDTPFSMQDIVFAFDKSKLITPTIKLN